MKRREFVKEIKALSADDLKQRGRSLGEELMKLRFRRASGQLDQNHRVREVRRNLARVKTALAAKSQKQAQA